MELHKNRLPMELLMRPCKQKELLVRPCKWKELLVWPCKKKEPKEPTVREGLEL